MEKRSYHHGALRAALVEAGLDLLGARAADDLSLREVARAVGVSATAVYRHFPDKGALMTALAREGLDRLAVAQRAAAEAAGGGAAGFAATGRAYVRFALHNPALFRLIFASPILQAAPGDPEVSEAANLLRANAARVLADRAEEGDERVVAVRAWALVHGLAMLMLDGQIPADQGLVEAAISAREAD
jgi:AcrR family transcriptional regulator